MFVNLRRPPSFVRWVHPRPSSAIRRSASTSSARPTRDFDEDDEEDIPLCPELERFEAYIYFADISYLDEILSPRFRYNRSFHARLIVCTRDDDDEVFLANLNAHDDFRRWKEEGRLEIDV